MRRTSRQHPERDDASERPVPRGTAGTESIALVVPETDERLFSEPYFFEIIHGAAAEIFDADKVLLLIPVHTERERVRLSGYLAGSCVDGVLLVSVHGRDPLLDVMEELGLPVVLGGRRPDPEPLSYVHVENVGGARTAVGHLLSRGCRTVATITGDLDQEGARDRLEGYRHALEDAGLPYDESLVARADFSEASAVEAMSGLLYRRPDLDGVFAASDVMAAGVLRVLREAHRHVPGDVAVVGFDDSEVARTADPPLTSVRQPIEEMGRTMARLLLDEIADPGRARRQIVLGTELVGRASA
jgi:DNA-binding LacI/PurR family transcriptional regulator